MLNKKWSNQKPFNESSHVSQQLETITNNGLLFIDILSTLEADFLLTVSVFLSVTPKAFSRTKWNKALLIIYISLKHYNKVDYLLFPMTSCLFVSSFVSSNVFTGCLKYWSGAELVRIVDYPTHIAQLDSAQATVEIYNGRGKLVVKDPLTVWPLPV